MNEIIFLVQESIVVVFDPASFPDTATFEAPHQYATGVRQYATGVRQLFVNGRLAIDEGRLTGALGGRAFRHGTPPSPAADDDEKGDSPLAAEKPKS